MFSLSKLNENFVASCLPNEIVLTAGLYWAGFTGSVFVFKPDTELDDRRTQKILQGSPLISLVSRRYHRQILLFG